MNNVDVVLLAAQQAQAKNENKKEVQKAVADFLIEPFL